MKLNRTTTPEALVSIDDMREFARVNFHDDDRLLQSAIQSAVEEIDAPHGLLGRALVTQTWAMTLPVLTNAVRLPFPPIQSIESITYADAAGHGQTLAPEAYALEDDLLRPIGAWPSMRDAAITYVAGYGAPHVVPAPLSTWVKARALTLYDGREASAVDDASIASYRRWSF